MESIELLVEIIKQEYVLIFGFFFIAMLYSSIGFGGGSSYTAILSLTNMPFVSIRAISLLCNIVVVSNNTFQYLKRNLINYKKVIPLVLSSVPFAYFGGILKINQQIFYLLLGFTLVLAAFLMLGNRFFSHNKIVVKKSHNSFYKNVIIGSFIGLLSGLVGIGGGVFLAPFLHITKWDTPKKIMATSSLFILVNSIAGLIGQIQNPFFKLNIPLTLVLVITVFFGGLIGSKFSLRRFKVQNIKFITAILITIVGIKLIYTYI